MWPNSHLIILIRQSSENNHLFGTDLIFGNWAMGREFGSSSTNASV